MKEMKHATENICSRVKQMEDKINDLEGRNFEITLSIKKKNEQK